MLDMSQAQQTLTQLRQAAEPRPADPALPLEMERAKHDAERSDRSREFRFQFRSGPGCFERGCQMDDSKRLLIVY